MNKELSVRDQVRNRFLGGGVAWCIAAVLGLIENPICHFLYMGCLLVSIILTVGTIVRKKEKEDEMAKANLNEAISISFWICQPILIFVSIIVGDILFNILEWDINVTPYLTPFVLFFIGLQEIIIGVAFRKLEEE